MSAMPWVEATSSMLVPRVGTTALTARQLGAMQSRTGLLHTYHQDRTTMDVNNRE